MRHLVCWFGPLSGPQEQSPSSNALSDEAGYGNAKSAVNQRGILELHVLWGTFEYSGALIYRLQIVGLVLQGHPRNRAPIYRNSHVGSRHHQTTKSGGKPVRARLSYMVRVNLDAHL